jgi:hypothetical protein
MRVSLVTGPLRRWGGGDAIDALGSGVENATDLPCPSGVTA